MNKVIGIRFKSVGKKYYFDPAGYSLDLGDKVIVETVRGIELGEVIESVKDISNDEIISTLKPVLRMASKEDIERHDQNRINSKMAVSRIDKYIKKHKLDMKLLGCEYTLDRTKLIIYFNAEGRVDFRELVKDLALEFRVRIELRQVGTRDGAKFLGGIGPCGYVLCCNTFLGDFETVSIKMAKNQNLSLNPVNISGLCGKLLCCIKYEDETYKENRKILPKLNSYVKTAEGRGRVLSVNVVECLIRVELPENGIKTFKVHELLEIEQFDKVSAPNNGE